MTGPRESRDPEWARFITLLRFVIAGTLLIVTVGEAALGYAREPYVWTSARWANLTWALLMSVVSLGLIGVIVQVTRHHVQARWIAWVWCLGSFAWVSTAVFTLLGSQIGNGLRIMLTLEALAIALAYATSWRVSLRERVSPL